MPRWTGWLVVMLLLSLGLAMPSVSGAQLSGLAQVEPDEPLQAAIYPGACVSPGEPVRTALAPLQKPPGEIVRGLPWVLRTEIEIPLAALQADSYAVVVAAGDDLLDTAVACGDLNALTTADGMAMVVGLFERQTSLTTGIAVLTAIGERTEVRVYVARALSGGYPFGNTDFGVDSSSGEGDAGVDDGVEVDVGVDTDTATGDDAVLTITVRVNEDSLTMDQIAPVFEVGQTVEFRVINDGLERHEAMLEELGGNEEPLEIDDETQAETEDLAPEAEATIRYTFSEPGEFQLADHIGDNFDDGLLAIVTVVTSAPAEE